MNVIANAADVSLTCFGFINLSLSFKKSPKSSKNLSFFFFNSVGIHLPKRGTDFKYKDAHLPSDKRLGISSIA